MYIEFLKYLWNARNDWKVSIVRFQRSTEMYFYLRSIVNRIISSETRVQDS